MVRYLTAVALLVSLGAGSAAAQDVPDNTWTPSGPRFSTILALERDPQNPAVLLAGAYFGGLYRSTDYGFTWTHLTTAFSSRTIFSISYVSSNTIYVGTFNDGVYRSDDGGSTWEAKNNGLTDLTVETVAADPLSAVVLAATVTGVFRSADGGGSWARVDTETPPLHGKAIAFDPAAAGVVYLGTIGRGVFRSVDGGQTFEHFSEGIVAPATASVLAMRFGPPPSRHLYVGTDQGAFKLRRNETTWVDLSSAARLSGNLPAFPINDVLPHPVVENVLIGATFVGVYSLLNDETQTDWVRWTDSPIRVMTVDPTGFVFHAATIHGGLSATFDFGGTWLEANYGFQNLFIGALNVVDFSGTPVVYAGSDYAFHRGAWGSWETFFDQKQGIFDIQPDPGNPGTVYIGSERNGVWKSTDAGMNWASASTNLVPAQIFALGQSADGSGLLAGTSSGLYLGPTDGSVWLSGTATQLGIVTAVAPDPTRAPLSFIGGSDGKVLFSQDGGYSYRDAFNGLPPEMVTHLYTAPWEKTYAITLGGGLFATSDYGLNWFPAKAGVAAPASAITSEPVRAWVLYLGTSGSGIYKSVSGSLDWEPVNTGLTSPWIFSVTVDHVAPETVYAGTLDGVFKSTNGGTSWVRRSDGLATGAVTTLIVDVANANIVYASVQDAGIYRSTDGGQTWTSISGSLPIGGALPLLQDRTNPARLMAGTTYNGVYTTIDYGITWERASYGMTLFVRGLAIDPSQTSTLYAGSLGAGIFKSTDGAGSWTNVGLSDRNVFKLGIDPIQTQTVYAATSRGVSRTSDGGATWHALGQKVVYAGAMAVDASDRRRLWVGSTAGSVYRSSDGGTTWEPANQGLPLTMIMALAYDPAGDLLYAAADRQGVWVSTNGGTSWIPMASAALDPQQVMALTIAPDHRLFAATAGGGIWVWEGAYWSSASTGLASPAVADVESAGGGVMLAATFWAGVFRSTDGGSSWSWASSGLTTRRVNALTADPAVPGRVYAATPDGVFRTDDGGLTWVALNNGMRGINTWSVVVDGATPGHLLAGTNGRGVFVSTNGGQAWSASTGLHSLDVRIVEAGANGSFYAGTLGGGVGRSLDGGSTWIGGTGHDIVEDVVLAMVVNPANPSIVYAATSGRGVLKSTNGGVNWRPVTNGLGSLFLLSLTIDRQNPDTLYAGTADGGVFLTVNGGTSWQPLNDGLFNHVVTSLAISPVDDRRLYAGTEGGGVFTTHVSLPTTSCSYVPSTTLLATGYQADELVVTVTTSASCAWRVESETGWLTVTGGATRMGSGSVSVAVALNSGEDARSGLVFVAGQPVAIVQEGTLKLHRLTVVRAGTGSGSVSSNPIGIDCGTDCEQMFTGFEGIVLTATPAQGSQFVGWEGPADCADGELVLGADVTCTARFEQTDDFDDDGLPNLWEAKFGLDAGSGTGDDGPNGDPDGDGRTNAQELADGTHPRGFFVRYFAQGRADAGYRTAVALFNALGNEARVLVRLLPDAGDEVAEYRHLPARSRAVVDTLALSTVPAAFAIVIESDREVVAERTIDRGAPFARTGEVAAAAAPTWFSATGTTRTGHTTVHTLFNPGAAAAPVTVTYLPVTGTPVARSHSVPARGRLEIDMGADSLISNTDIASAFSSSIPIVVETTVALDDAQATVLAAPTPAYLHFLADGRTGPLTSSVIDVLNPTGSATTSIFTYVLAGGGIAQRQHTVPAFGRIAVNPAGDDALLTSARFGVIIHAPVPLVVSTSTWWPGSVVADWYAGAATGALPSAGRRWAIASGHVYGPDFDETEIAIMNFATTAGTARITLVFDDGTTTTRDVALPAVAHTTVDVSETFPEAAWRSFSAVIESVAPGGGTPVDVVVEHSTYASPGGVSRAGGMRVGGTRLPD